MNANAEAAFTWLSLNVSPIPVIPGTKLPAVEWHQWQSHTPPPKVVDYWFRDPARNVGIICGGPSNLAIIDFDDIEYYYQWRKESIKKNDEISEIAGKTYRVQTARGMHLYVYTTRREKSRKDREHAVDLRCSANYTLVPPSIHPSGVPYQPIGCPESIVTVSSLSGIVPDKNMGYGQTPGQDNSEVDIFKPVQINVTVDLIKHKLSMLSFVAQFSHPHRTSSDGRWWMARCIHPMHEDRSPSFQIDAVANRAKCLSSRCEFYRDKGMDVIDLYASLHHLSMSESIHELGSYYL